MAEITLRKNDERALSEEQRQLLRDTLFAMIDGLSEADQKSWRRFWNWIVKARRGEVFSIETWAPRQGWFHRKHMAIEASFFKCQDRIKTFEQFRAWLKIGAGFVDWMAGPKGGVVPVPKSISYKKCDEDTMRQFHEAAIAFLRGEHAPRYLWPHLTPLKAAEMVEAILCEFEE